MTLADKIIDAVKTTFGVTDSELTSKRRYKNLVDARTAAAYFLITEGRMAQDAVERKLNRTRCWASWALYRCPAIAEVDKAYSKKVMAVYDSIKGKALCGQAA